MIKTIRDYFHAFLGPFETHRELKRRRTHKLTLVTEQLNDEQELTYYELMSTSWLMTFCYSAYSLMAIHMGYVMFDFLGDQSGYADLIIPNYEITASRLKIFGILFEVIFAPLALYVYYKFWSLILRFFFNIFEVEGDQERIVEQVVSYSMVSNTLLLVPIFGKIFKFLFSFIYIYAGLKENAGLSKSQAILTLSAPFFLITGLIAFSLVYFSFVAALLL